MIVVCRTAARRQSLFGERQRTHESLRLLELVRDLPAPAENLKVVAASLSLKRTLDAADAKPNFRADDKTMSQKRRAILLIFALTCLFALTAAASPNPREEQTIVSGWKFHLGDVDGAEAESFDDSGWTPVELPHTWNARDGQDGGNN